MSCPNSGPNCDAADPNQRDLYEGEKTRLTEKAAAAADGAKVCSYCGLVYVEDYATRHVRRLGWLNGQFEPASGYK